MNPHDLRIHATEELITLSAAATHFNVQDKTNWVELVPHDILSSLNEDQIVVTRIIINGEAVGLSDNPIKLRDGQLYVSEIERLRFKQANAVGKDPIYHVFNIDHPNYSKSLDAALSAWMVVCDSDQAEFELSMKKRVKNWLEANYEFSDGMNNSIASVVNPHKEGGRIKKTNA